MLNVDDVPFNVYLLYVQILMKPYIKSRIQSYNAFNVSKMWTFSYLAVKVEQVFFQKNLIAMSIGDYNLERA